MKFPKIHNLQNAVKNNPEVLNTIYCAKPKIHGTNARLVVKACGQDLECWSKTRIITEEKDNAGFATWVNSIKDEIQSNFDNLEHELTLYGEWAGPKIQKGVAVNLIPEHTFFIFAAYYDGELLMHPDRISYFVYDLPNTKVLPCVLYDIDPKSAESLAKVKALVEIFDREDPYIKQEFGISGIGEGLVMYPDIDYYRLSMNETAAYLWKAKGTKHSESKEAKAFAANFVTEERCRKAIAEIGAKHGEMTRMGDYLKYIHQDTQAECAAELEVANLTWKQVAKEVTFIAKKYFTDGIV